jgi:phenylacetate-CoA ligase
MSDAVLQLYHRLPAPIRSLAASVRGISLRARRYNSDTDKLVAAALEREHWTHKEWESWRQERLGFLLHRAATRVPYYREQWAVRRRSGDRSSAAYLENWPILDKDPLRENPYAFVADDCQPRKMIEIHTSGTTGKSLTLWRSKDTERAWYALFEARCRHWYGVSRHDRWAALGGQLIAPVNMRKPPFWVWNAALNQLYMSSYHLAPDLIPHYLHALKRYRIEFLWGYSSSLYELAQEALRSGRRDLQMKVVITNAEPLFDYQRQVIAAAFQCPVRETYGMTEIVVGASECQAGRLHQWPEAGHLEIMQNDRPVLPGIAGELLCTGLLNEDMPLIRYRVGDHAKLPIADELCNCGRTLPGLDSVEGRIDDVLYTADGRCIGRLDPVFKANLPVHEVQIIQEKLDRLRVRYVPTRDFIPEAGRSITERLQARMGNVNVVLEEVSEVPRGANGKFRAVVCDLSTEERATLGRV